MLFGSLLELALGEGPVQVQAVAPEQEQPRGGYEYIRQPRKKQRESHEEREEIRRLLQAALKDDAPEAEALIAVAEPFISTPKPNALKVDWVGMAARMDAVQAALERYEARLRAEEEEDEDISLLLMVA